MIRVLICDDQDVVREGLRSILGTASGIEVVALAENGARALELFEQHQPDVVLMDLNMPVMNGIQATRRLRERHPDARILALTTYDADEWVFDVIRAGAAGYLLKDTPRAELIRAIEGTANGLTFVDPNVAGKLFSRVSGGRIASDAALAAELSARERDIVKLLARGMSNADIANRLHLSEGTVRNYVSSIFDKLGVADRTQAAIVALRHGLGE
ncbi:MAG TPA: response regulator transcription factor [Rhodanobacteraceae bacterium]|nr:response regulator transcription factor [Rhodanobacteraceae bacterium]